MKEKIITFGEIMLRMPRPDKERIIQAKVKRKPNIPIHPRPYLTG